MKIFNIDGKDYTLEYSFMAAEHKETVQNMFDVMSGAYLIKKTKIDKDHQVSKEELASIMMEGTGEMVADIPHITKIAFYAGLLENHEVSQEESYDLMKQYMKENKIGFRKLFEDIKTCMEDDGFFDLSGLTEALNDMKSVPEEETKQKAPKIPQDHKMKSSGTK